MITSDLRAKSGCSRQFSQGPRNATRSFRAFVGLQNRRPFSKSTKTIYSPHFHSKVCFTMILKIAVWSQQDLSLPNPAHSSRSLSSSTSFILYRMIFPRTLLALFRSIMSSPLLLQAKIPQVHSYSPEGCSLYYIFLDFGRGQFSLLQCSWETGGKGWRFCNIQLTCRCSRTFICRVRIDSGDHSSVRSAGITQGWPVQDFLVVLLPPVKLVVRIYPILIDSGLLWRTLLPLIDASA